MCQMLQLTQLMIFFLKFQMELIHGARISPKQFLFWLLMTLLHIVNAYCEIINYVNAEDEHKNLLPLITTLGQTILIIGCLISHFFSESRPDYQSPGRGLESSSASTDSKESPIMNASFPSILAFSWFTGFAWKGFKRSLGFDDLHDLPP